MLTVEDARQRILSHVHPLAAEEITVTDALGRILAANAVSGEDLPGFANSAMDGYAILAHDSAGASESAPRSVRLVGEVPAGRVYPGVAHAGEAVRILTGAPVPDGADAVLQQELTRVQGDTVELLAEVTPGNNIRFPGEDVRSGTLLVPAGAEIGPAEIALLAAAGVHRVAVSRRPRVAILATGDELAPLGTDPAPGQIHESNSPYLVAAVTRAGAIAMPLGIARDQADDIRARLRAAQEADLLLTSGGVSVGDYDLVKQILAEQGNIEFWRVRMRPGKPVAFGLLGQTPLLGLPGNPVSAAVTFELFGRPAIRRMLGCATLLRPKIEVVLEDGEIQRADRQQYVRARLFSRDGTLVARTTGAQDSHIISSLRGATALLVVDIGEGVVRAGDHLPALLLNDALPWADEI